MRRIAMTYGFLVISAFPGKADVSPLLEKAPEKLSYCGDLYAPPFASQNDGKRPRICAPAQARGYTPLNRSIATEALDIESEQCFVPDDAYHLLDEIISAVKSRVGEANDDDTVEKKKERALAIGKATGDVMEERGFGLYIPTETLGDALVPKSKNGTPARHVFDCDTGSLIVLAVAESLQQKAALVEITLSSGSGHNFVRWSFDKQVVDWDVNGRSQCAMPLNNPSFQGRAMTHDETISYITSIRGMRWQKNGNILEAIKDYRRSIALFPQHPLAYNNFSWLVATRSFPERESLAKEASNYADELIRIQPNANNLDTAACMSAFLGRFDAAAELEERALRVDPGNGTFTQRAAQFRATPPKDCTGFD